MLPGPRGGPGEAALHGFGEIREAVADDALEVVYDATSLAGYQISHGSNGSQDFFLNIWGFNLSFPRCCDSMLGTCNLPLATITDIAVGLYKKKTKSKERRLAIHSGRGSTRSINAGGYCQKIGSDTKLGLSMTRKNSSGKTQLDKSLSDVPFNVVGSHGAFPKPYMIPEVTSVRRISNGESHPRDPVRPQYPLVN